MPLVPYCVRVETADDLEVALNAALAPLLAHQILGIEIDQAKPGPFFTKNIYAAFSTLPGSAVPTPFQFKVFSEADESTLISKVTAFITANPTYFFSGIYVFYRTESPNPNQGVSGGIFYNQTPAAAVNWNTSGGSSSPSFDIQVFTISGVWTKPIGAQEVDVSVIGTGGGGGSGRRGAAGSNRSGGGGGGPGGFIRRSFRASSLAATENVVIGAPGVGAAAITVDNTNGASGTQGSDSWFGTTPLARASGGAAGGGGATTSGASGAAGQPIGANGGGGGGSNTAGGSAAFGWTGGSGGGGGGGLDTANTPRNGGFGASIISADPTKIGNQGIAPGGDGANGVPQAMPYMPGPGGGGGASQVGGPGGRGGDGGAYGGGGGGGAASENGQDSGRGGDGGPALVVVVTSLGAA